MFLLSMIFSITDILTAYKYIMHTIYNAAILYIDTQKVAEVMKHVFLDTIYYIDLHLIGLTISNM